jgi:Raf kinase inhibitor-like YbhB/YbcL family protein
MISRMRTTFPLLLALAAALLIAACGSSVPTSTPPATGGMALSSSAFEAGTAIPAKYTCAGDDISPALQWSGPPPDTASFALIMDDPDAPGGTWVHWVVYNLPPDTHSLLASIPAEQESTGEGFQGSNSWGRLGYGGPCPPSGTHRYFFKLYALDTTLDLAAGATKEQVTQAMAGHILVQTELMGTFTHQ